MRKEVALRARQALTDSGLSYQELSKRIGCTYQAVRNWAVGEREPSLDTIDLIARATGVDVYWILTGNTSPSGVEVLDENVISIPVLDARASAGDGLMLFEDEQILRRLDIDINWLRARCRFSHPDNLCTITASGDSMEPTIEDGDFLLIDSGVDTIRSDSIYIARVNDCIYVKRFQLTPRGTLLMLSDNTRYKEFEVDPERDQIKVIGKVVYQWHGMPR